MQKRVGSYQLVAELGKGQFGTVYKAVCCDDPARVFAVKCLPKAVVQKSKYMERLFETETSLMFKLDSPHIMKLHEINETQNNYYLVMTFCDGGDLDALLARLGRFPEATVLRYLRQLAQGFRALVAHNVMHRDIKLANLFLHGEQLVIGDLGFCRTGAALTSTQLGTPLTMSPEMLLCRGEVEYDNRTDLWSIGIVLYQMLCGRFPFEPETAQELMHMVQHESGDALAFPADAAVSPELRRLIQQLLQFEPARRLSWQAFFAHALVAGEPPAAPRPLDFSVTDPRWAAPAAPADPRDAYRHEEKKLEFFLSAVRSLQVAAQNPLVREGTGPLFLFASAAAFHKVLTRFARLAEELTRRANPAACAAFEAFVASRDFPRVLASLDENLRITRSLYDVLVPRTARQIADPQLRERLNALLRLAFDDLPQIDRSLRYCFEELRNVVQRLDAKGAELAELRVALLLLHIVIDDAEYLALGAGGRFSWEALRESVNEVAAQKLLG